MSATRARRRDAELTFLRLVPGDSVVHRLWAGTKLVVAAELALAVSISPSWQMLGVAGAVVALALVLGRIPLGAFPRLPPWFYELLVIGALVNLWSGTKPLVHIGTVALSIGALGEWARFTSFAVVLLVSGALIGWTTHLADVAPALSTLLRPLRWLRLPVDEWVIAVALAIRCLPLLIDEIRMLVAARRLRAHEHDEQQRTARLTVRRLMIESHNLMATAVITSIRRARDLADALVARGGVGGTVAATVAGPGLRDAVTFVLATLVLASSLFVLHF